MSGRVSETSRPAGISAIERLPKELLLSVLDLLECRDLVTVNQTNSWLYNITLPLAWRNVELVDQPTRHGDRTDQHDDTPILRLLLTFVNKPWIATCIQTLTHRCHQPPPSILDQQEGLGENPFCSQTLSTDPRTIWLVRKAVENLNNVHTLRIIFGHPTITDALLRCFFDSRRSSTANYNRPVRKLWLESCRISAGIALQVNDFPYNLPSQVSFRGIESVRFRRLPMDHKLWHWNHSRGQTEYVHNRGNNTRHFLHGLDDPERLSSTMTSAVDEWHQIVKHMLECEDGKRSRTRFPILKLLSSAQLWDDKIYDNLAVTFGLPEEVVHLGTMSHEERSRQQFCGQLSWWPSPAEEDIETLKAVRARYAADPMPLALNEWDILTDLPWQRALREQIPATRAAIQMLHSASHTLTSLNLDWVLTWFPRATDSDYHVLFQNLFACRFPNLRAFQLRNCVVRETKLPHGVYLLNPSNSATGPGGLEFMEAHSALECLAWPMEHFFPHQENSTELERRIDSVISNLGRSLTDLRVDTDYSGHGEPLSESVHCSRPEARVSRIRFITRFAAKMTSLESIKLEGGMPRDERREILRALHRCRLEKIVLIGVTSPIGNCWGPGGTGAYYDAEAIFLEEGRGLEGEDIAATISHGLKPASPLTPQSAAGLVFSPEFGWAGSPPMLSTMLSFFQDTITELKFCGYHGAAILFRPDMDVMETALLGPLKHFHKLESLIMSFWLGTIFEGQKRDEEVIQYWRDSKSPSSTALVVVDEPRGGDEESLNGWAKQLRTKFAPEALAKEIMRFLGPKVSEEAKARKGGLHIRASFALGDHGGVFDVDLRLGRDESGKDVCLEWTLPLQGTDPERWRDKLEKRRWF